MNKDKVHAHCPRCRHQQLFIRATVNHPLHLVLAVCTVGLWLVSWIALFIGSKMRPWRCEHCGWHKPDFERASQRRPATIARHAPVASRAIIHPPRLAGAQTSELRP